ncbi:hypothetical protein COEREDRAFT_81154 [Coemansia reversa NRRL 1564]|uniref:Myosin-binding domain-containing protein n=1 Tax=Coemansia reversa (strain ATCC 12441 / NRRL 1564) TaxID=763665 RepID=A0A2G5BBT5_COERN|nr:hypothetical protein COEREDRAFT_81154 [Coemansia reversa NRRL 1564]|eukprot:PIA16479.1 hypothetical protein COEREDRAFT_81154 [Coemansia reversa NRRL 1564]
MAAISIFALVSAVTTCSIYRNIRARKILRCANAYIKNLHGMLFYSRMLDNMLHRELCFVQEMDFISRGFRLPLINSPLQLSHYRPGRGTMFAAQHMRQKIGIVLVQTIKALTDIAMDVKFAEKYINSNLYKELRDATTKCMVLLDYYQDSECVLSLEYLRQVFTAQFTLRRLWLECVLNCFRIAADSDNGNQKQLLDLFQSTTKHIQCLRVASAGGLDELKSVREAQYSATRWKELAESHPGINQTPQPLIRPLTNMSDTLTTLQAKVLICQECIHATDGSVTQTLDTLTEARPNSERSPEEIARLFASLKSDIDMLGTHYQEAITRLLCLEDVDENVFGIDSTIGTDSGADALELSVDDVPSDARVFGYTLLSADGLDAPEMTFEANVEGKQLKSGRTQPTLDRNERIRLQRQRRVDEEADKERKGNVTTMMLELRSAIGNRTKGNIDSGTNEHRSDDHLDGDEDIEYTK